MSQADVSMGLEKAGAFVKPIMIRNAPTDTGEMRSKIGFKIEGTILTFYCDDPKASDMEWGTPPLLLTDEEKKELGKWEKRHNAPPGKVTKYVETHGIQVGTKDKPLHITSYGRDSYRPFMRPAIYGNLKQIAKIIGENVKWQP